MEPASVFLGIASATVTLGALALKVGQKLRTIVATHKQAAPLIYSLIGACQAIGVAWNRISLWIGSQSSATYSSDSSFFDQLTASIEVGNMVIDALLQDLEKDAHIQPGQTSVHATWRALLNEDVLQGHCIRLNLQLTSLHLLLATTKLSVLLVICDAVCPLLIHQQTPTRGSRPAL